MRHDDLPEFAQWLAELAEYFPHTKVNLEVLLRGYFHALRHLDLGMMRRLFDAVLRQCRFFPSVAELLAIAQTLAPQEGCPRCPGGHGMHSGHRVKHYPAGPWCETCAADMPTPSGYLECPPIKDTPRQLPQTTPEYSRHEVRELIEQALAAMNKRAEAFLSRRPFAGDDGEYRPRMRGQALEERRVFLRDQARDLHEEPPPC